ncbi:unnamed protein product [Hydatigera taeniaeformis]|uniref:DUF4614 domain-containing protein n=1 Tax=Hydatigena taeniaeformis TaxID=6205 RepID=A0A0R3WW71_HYDTA|nr:unnamed protein product [Hydatigera taeniaeformis]
MTEVVVPRHGKAWSGPDSINEDVTRSKNRAKAISSIDESNVCTLQEARKNEKRTSRNVGVMTDVEPRQSSSHADYYDQNAFITAVTAAVDHIIASSGPRPIMPCPLGARSVIDALTSHSPCLVALDKALREQLQITQTFLSTQRAMHDALKAALQKCLMPPLEPIDLHLNYVSSEAQTTILTSIRG